MHSPSLPAKAAGPAAIEAPVRVESLFARHETSGHGFFRTYVWAHDHKIIGLQYLFTSLVFMAFSGLLVMAVRWQLAFPGRPLPFGIGLLLPTNIVGPDGSILPGGYNALVTMHATVMVFLGVMPLLMGAFANYIIPLQIGALDMAFPFFNALS